MACLGLKPPLGVRHVVHRNDIFRRYVDGSWAGAVDTLRAARIHQALSISVASNQSSRGMKPLPPAAAILTQTLDILNTNSPRFGIKTAVGNDSG